MADKIDILKLSKSITINQLLAHSDGYLYASSGDGDDETKQVVYRINPSSGDVSIFATDLNTPDSITEGLNGNIFVAEWNTGNVIRLSPSGKSKLFINELGIPKAVLAKMDGSVLVAFQWHDDIKLHHYNSSGKLLEQMDIRNLTLDGAVLVGDDIYAVDEFSGSFYKIKSNGTVNVIAKPPKRLTQYGIQHLLYKNGYYYTTDSGKHIIYRISSDGEFNIETGKVSHNDTLSKQYPDRLYLPNALASFKKDNKIFVSQRRYQASSELKIISLSH
jgi:sugar lactone lactonase YvrE